MDHKYTYEFYYSLEILPNEKINVCYNIYESNCMEDQKKNSIEIRKGYSNDGFLLENVYFPSFDLSISYNKISSGDLHNVTVYELFESEEYDETSDLRFIIYTNEKLDDMMIEKINNVFLNFIIKKINSLAKNKSLKVILIKDPLKILPKEAVDMVKNYNNSKNHLIKYSIKYDLEKLSFKLLYANQNKSGIDEKEYEFYDYSYPILRVLTTFKYTYDCSNQKIYCNVNDKSVNHDKFEIPFLLDFIDKDVDLNKLFEKDSYSEKLIPISDQIKRCLTYFAKVIDLYIQSVCKEKTKVLKILEECRNMQLDRFYLKCISQ